MATASDHASSVPTASTALRLKLCYLNRTKLFSLPLPELSFSNILSLIAKAFPETQAVPYRKNSSDTSPHLHDEAHITKQVSKATHIELSYQDKDGDSVSIDSEDSLTLAARAFTKGPGDFIKLHIHVRNNQGNPTDSTSSVAASSWRSRDSRTTCRHFQAGMCRFGSSCRFLHPTTNKEKRSINKPGALLDGFCITEWLTTQRSASEHDNITYLTTQEGYGSLLQIINHPQLPQEAIHQLVGLLTRPKFRNSLLKQATDIIFHSLIGSQFLVVLHSHIRTSVKPDTECIKPYVFLCEEIVRRTASEGWKEAPLDELKTLLDTVNNESARQLQYIVARLLDLRAKTMRLEAVDEQMDAPSLVSALLQTLAVEYAHRLKALIVAHIKITQGVHDRRY